VEIENTPIVQVIDEMSCGRGLIRVLRNAEIVGLASDKCPVCLAMASEEVSRTRVR
jgi:hypothetical protein